MKYSFKNLKPKPFLVLIQDITVLIFSKDVISFLRMWGYYFHGVNFRDLGIAMICSPL